MPLIALIPEETADATAALQIADARMYEQKNGGRPFAARQSRAVLLRALEERSPELLRHLGGVARLAGEVAERLALSSEEVEHVRQAAELHDVGKMAIPDAILSKPGPLDPSERAFLRRHTLVGERIVGAAPALAPVARLVRSSHERLGGEGYPDRTAGEEIPLGSRIIAVCDAYDAMTSDRPYAGAPCRRRRRSTSCAAARARSSTRRSSRASQSWSPSGDPYGPVDVRSPADPRGVHRSLTTLALAMTGAVLLVTDFIYASKALVAGAAGATAVLFAVLWYLLALARQRHDDRTARRERQREAA